MYRSMLLIALLLAGFSANAQGADKHLLLIGPTGKEAKVTFPGGTLTTNTTLDGWSCVVVNGPFQVVNICDKDGEMRRSFIGTAGPSSHCLTAPKVVTWSSTTVAVSVSPKAKDMKSC